MITPSSPTEKLLFTTVRIETDKEVGTELKVCNGSGFFFKFRVGSDSFLHVIVTNKHVIRGALKGRFNLHEYDKANGKPSGKFFQIELNEFEHRWIHHPDTSVDLCAMPVKPILEGAKKQGREVFSVSFEESNLPTQDLLNNLTAVEDILMTGYPNGLWDRANNLPLIRKGITSSHPALDYCQRSEFMIDAACFPGSSGSPVMLANIGSHPNKRGGITLGNRIALLGVLYAGPQITVKGEITNAPVPTETTQSSQINIMMHLGLVVKSQELLKLGDAVKSACGAK